MLSLIILSLFTHVAAAEEPVLNWPSGKVAWTGDLGFYTSGQVLWHDGRLFHDNGELAYDARRGLGLDRAGNPTILDGQCLANVRRSDETCRVSLGARVQLRLVSINGQACPILSLGPHEVQPSCEGAFRTAPPEPPPPPPPPPAKKRR